MYVKQFSHLLILRFRKDFGKSQRCILANEVATISFGVTFITLI